MTITNIKFKSDTLIIRNTQLFMYKTHTINYTSLIYSSIFRGYKVHGVPSQRVTRMGTKSITYEVLIWVEEILFLLGGQPLYGVRKFKYLGIVLEIQEITCQNSTQT